eukprot:scaffold457224_cov20-Prasinocladus_malaysianus.AAC.1
MIRLSQAEERDCHGCLPGRTECFGSQVAENYMVDGNRSYTISHEVTDRDKNWNLKSADVPNVTVVVTDNDSIGVLLEPTQLNIVEFGDPQVWAPPTPCDLAQHYWKDFKGEIMPEFVC